jgi:hypothetical protein
VAPAALVAAAADVRTAVPAAAAPALLVAGNNANGPRPKGQKLNDDAPLCQPTSRIAEHSF